MDIHVEFLFRAIKYYCSAIIDSSEYPCYIFVMLEDPGLINKFGDDITISTDGNRRLPKKEDYATLVELSEAIFNVIKEVPEFRAVKMKMKILSQEILKI